MSDITRLEQYKIAQEEYMLYSRATVQSDIILIGAAALFYSWMATTESKFPAEAAYIGPLLILAGYVRGFLLGQTADQVRRYMMLLESDGFECGMNADLGWQQWRARDINGGGSPDGEAPLRSMALINVHRIGAVLFWGLLYSVSCWVSSRLCATIKPGDGCVASWVVFGAGIVVVALLHAVCREISKRREGPKRTAEAKRQAELADRRNST